MRFIDFFAGIGGFRLGMEMAGHECVGHCEIDKYADRSYRAMHEVKDDEWFADDITRVKPEDLPEAGCYCFGFPCQSFSIAGNRGGFDDIRGTLFFEVMRMVKARQPKVLFAENVRGLLNHDGGATFATIIRTMDELGYCVEWQVLNSRYFGTPQNRERVFIVGHSGGPRTRKIFPIIEKDSGTRIVQVGKLKDKKRDNPNRFRVYDPHGLSPCLHTMGGGGQEPYIVAERGRGDGWKQQLEPRKDGLTNALTTVTTDNMVAVGQRIRKLTPKECFRLQGFPDDYFERAAKVNSDSQLYKQAGNSVTVNVIYEIAKRLKEE